MLELEYREDKGSKKRNQDFGKVKVVNKGSNVFLLSTSSGLSYWDWEIKNMLEDAAGGSRIRVHSRLKLTSLDGKTSIETYTEPGRHSTLNGKPINYGHSKPFKFIKVDLRFVLRQTRGLSPYGDELFVISREKFFELFIQKIGTINSSKGVLFAADEFGELKAGELKKLVTCLQSLVKRKRLMAAVITVRTVTKSNSIR